MSLTGKQRNFLRGLAHHKPITVTIGNAGLSTAVIKELISSQNAHEILKVKLPGGSNSQKKQLINEICEQTESDFVQLIGRVGIIYKPGNPAKIELPE